MPRLAFTTFAILKVPYGDPRVAGFEALTPAVFRKAEAAEGFIARARARDNNDASTNFERDWGEWGPFAVPRFYDGGFETGNDTHSSTLSLWTSVAAVRTFTCSGLHRRALDQRARWFRKPDWPTHAMWWVADDRIPTWTEACGRLEHLHDNGPDGFAFDFSHPARMPAPQVGDVPADGQRPDAER